jgi:hypothetical protein
MSGGHFDYKQWEIANIADSIETELNKQGSLKPKDELWHDEDYYKKYPEEKYYTVYPEKVASLMKEGIAQLRKAYIYAQRIDWYLSGDDGDETFPKRLNEDLNKLNK